MGSCLEPSGRGSDIETLDDAVFTSPVIKQIGFAEDAFKNQKGIDRVEVLTFRRGLVIEGHGLFVAS